MADVVLFGHTSLEIIQLVGECCSCQAAGPRLNYLLVRRHSAKLSFYFAIFNTLPVTGYIISHIYRLRSSRLSSGAMERVIRFFCWQLSSYMITRVGGKERESK
ncbi:hypothetical protein T03_10864 [Trichinella britovi]|uniref:Uncharacterized protein n=1 Tax=Trichinella britovi TaxID=45882 RepID=A0A0V1D655_TRIBR|nr:hypothetical protein T03_10864 [Trichinella britovi]